MASLGQRLERLEQLATGSLTSSGRTGAVDELLKRLERLPAGPPKLPDHDSPAMRVVREALADPAGFGPGLMRRLREYVR